MAKSLKKPKRRQDLNHLAARIVAEATAQAPKTDPPEAGKDPAAVAQGAKGGKTGGQLRAASLTPEQRSEIAKKAATRWQKKDDYRPRPCPR